MHDGCWNFGPALPACAVKTGLPASACVPVRNDVWNSRRPSWNDCMLMPAMLVPACIRFISGWFDVSSCSVISAPPVERLGGQHVRVPRDQRRVAARAAEPRLRARRADLVDDDVRVVVEAAEVRVALVAGQEDAQLELDQVAGLQRTIQRRRRGDLLDQHELAVLGRHGRGRRCSCCSGRTAARRSWRPASSAPGWTAG